MPGDPANLLHLLAEYSRYFAAILGLVAAVLAGRAFQNYVLKALPARPNAAGPKAVHNLPPLPCVSLVGRESELTLIVESLQPEVRCAGVLISGVAGVGKTTLALAAANRCLDRSMFELVVFVSARRQTLTPHGIAERTTAGIVTQLELTVGTLLGRKDILATQPEERRVLISAALAGRPTLLVVDNLETTPDPDLVLEYLLELPSHVKSIITSRGIHRVELYRVVELRALTPHEATLLIALDAEDRGITLTEDDIRHITDVAGGLPLAIEFAVGQISLGYSPDSVLEAMRDPKGALLLFLLEATFQIIRGTLAHRLLLALALLPAASTLEAATQVIGLESDTPLIEEAVVQLRRLNLVVVDGHNLGLHQVTRAFARAEPDFRDIELLAAKALKNRLE